MGFLHPRKAHSLLMKKAIQYFKSVFTLDLRALALLRIGIAAVVLLDLCIRATDLKAHYTDEGLLPLSALFQYAWDSWNISIHNVSGLWFVQVMLFVAAAFFALAMMLGWKTKLSTALSWLLLMSLQNRNNLILQGGDDLLRMILFWGIFLPWGKCYSLDKLRSNELSTEYSYFGIASIGYVVQIVSVYVFSALLKEPSPEWTSDGTAIYYALSLDQMVFPIGKLIYPYVGVLKFLTFTVYYIELLVPLLFFVPFYSFFFRSIAILMLIFLHMGIALTLFVGLFFIIGIVSLIGLFPSQWLNKAEKKLAWVRKKYYPVANDVAEIATIEKEPIRIFRQLILLPVIIYILLWNWQTTSFSNFKIEGDIRGVGQLIGVNQNWGMFAPSVFKDDGWYVYEARTNNGQLIDIGNGGNPVNYTKPENAVSFYKNDRWRKYSENYLFVCNNCIRPYYCDYIFSEWNNNHPDQTINELKIIYMKEITLPDYQYVEPTREVLASIILN